MSLKMENLEYVQQMRYLYMYLKFKLVIDSFKIKQF